MKKAVNKKEKIILSNTNDKLFFVLLIILTILTIVLLVFLIEKRSYIDIEDSRIKDVYKYFKTEDFENCGGLLNYDSELVNFDTLTDDEKTCIAYHNLNIDKIRKNETKLKIKDGKETCATKDKLVFRYEEDTEVCPVYEIPAQKMRNSYKKIFGVDMEESKSFSADNTHVCYLKDDVYLCGYSETYTYVLANDSKTYRVIKDIEEKGSEMIVYDYFIKTVDSSCYTNYNDLKVNNECTSKMKKKKNLSYNFVKKYGTLYKHVYEKNEDGSFHWVSSEQVNK